MIVFNVDKKKVQNLVVLDASDVNGGGTGKTFEQLGITKTTSSDTFEDLALEIQALGLANSTAIYGEVRNTPMPSDVVNAEVKIEILETKSNGKQVMLFTLYSTNVEPHIWQFVYYQPQYTAWEWVSNSSSAQVALLSITTAPTGTFAKGSKYYNSTTKLIYTATADNTWGTDGTVPQFFTVYIYDNNRTTEYYQWDGDNLIETDLEKYQLILNTKWYDMAQTTATFTATDFTQILQVFVNGLALRPTKDYTIASGNVITFTTALTTADELGICGVLA